MFIVKRVKIAIKKTIFILVIDINYSQNGMIFAKQ